MDSKMRADLVRDLLEAKQAIRMRGFRKPGDPSDSDRSFGDYNRRRMRDRDYGGDASIFDGAARWDRHRASSPSRRRRLQRARRDPGGYVGYEGNFSHLNRHVDVAGTVRSKLRPRRRFR